MSRPQTSTARQFVSFAIERGALLFGEFQTKAGRLSPYFFNSGLFNDGASMAQLSYFYAQAALNGGVAFDMLFGPAYKGITLATGLAIKLAEAGRNVPYAFNRKEAKDHGEGGRLVGARLADRVLIVDDVISAGTSVRESIDIIRHAGAVPAGVLISLDRMERGQGARSAVQEVIHEHGIPVVAVATVQDIVEYLMDQSPNDGKIAKIAAYRAQYGVTASPETPTDTP